MSLEVKIKMEFPPNMLFRYLLFCHPESLHHLYQDSFITLQCHKPTCLRSCGGYKKNLYQVIRMDEPLCNKFTMCNYVSFLIFQSAFLHVANAMWKVFPSRPFSKWPNLANGPLCPYLPYYNHNRIKDILSKNVLY